MHITEQLVKTCERCRTGQMRLETLPGYYNRCRYWRCYQCGHHDFID